MPLSEHVPISALPQLEWKKVLVTATFSDIHKQKRQSIKLDCWSSAWSSGNAQTHILTHIIAKQIMIKKPLMTGSTKPLVTFEVLSTHKGWSLCKVWGLWTYSVQSQGLLQRKVKPHRPMSWGFMVRIPLLFLYFDPGGMK